jgi:peptide/nickel transport system ATP-binding protein
VLVMKDGVVGEQGTAQHILEAPKEDYTRRLIGAVARGYAGRLERAATSPT